MQSLFNSLPGLELPFDEIPKIIAKMWQSNSAEDSANSRFPFRASQLNLILHLGRASELDQVKHCFDQCVRFSQKYPCRVIILCPFEPTQDKSIIKSKLFCECFVGENLREICCCEILTLGYSPEERSIIENQIFLWIESDLPTYYWINKVQPKVLLENFNQLTEASDRLIFDSHIEGIHFEDSIKKAISKRNDLSFARLLPIRQSLGQFFSNYTEETIIKGLKSVSVLYNNTFEAEAHQLLAWMREALLICENDTEKKTYIDFSCTPLPHESSNDIEVQWNYEDTEKLFKIKIIGNLKRGYVIAKLGQNKLEIPLHLQAMNPAETLSAALFY